ncbi:hypothetical protein COU56_03215 [Candidatus Pacearchaeota archaeon CG10_big_fil_rev_8_21_14_0_10_31_9]|nr:MAG: hypothetical protein AUJ62_02540 [Candidatus Pacearchaeota archaeon CG1_02_32_21]PIN94060.1 MAG: hypothetical protein COU56_03215 [Candidatus Pacearchaeota archaeon CG10_big_fil_rev_8_21_14_0_10_31_9]PIZ82496.1 MAG: hypothetical protein COX97_04580 [Candidatus Pacearchaeota archaeon CG_4_10_14_0_2_um_filter_05_32_18]
MGPCSFLKPTIVLSFTGSPSNIPSGRFSIAVINLEAVSHHYLPEKKIVQFSFYVIDLIMFLSIIVSNNVLN